MSKEYPHTRIIKGWVNIYQLSDSAGNIFYVGATSRPIEERLRGHLSSAKSYRNTTKDVLIRSLNFQIYATIIDRVHVVGPWHATLALRASSVENAWIAKFRDMGYPLVNAPAKKRLPAETPSFIGKKISYEDCLPQ